MARHSNPHMRTRQQAKARKVVAYLYQVNRAVPGDPTEHARTWTFILSGDLGDKMRDEAWEKLYQGSGIPPTTDEDHPDVNPSYQVRAIVLDTINFDLRVEAEAQARVDAMSEADEHALFDKL